MSGFIGQMGTWVTIKWLRCKFSSVAQSCPTLCDPMDCSTPGLPVHHQLLEFTQTHVHRVRSTHPKSISSVLCCKQNPYKFWPWCKCLLWIVTFLTGMLWSSSPFPINYIFACLRKRIMTLMDWYYDSSIGKKTSQHIFLWSPLLHDGGISTLWRLLTFDGWRFPSQHFADPPALSP